MSITLFEVLCIFIIVLALAAMARTRPVGALALDYVALAVAAWMGEQSCITLYRFYEYSPDWHGRLGDVPVLVPLIWPLVILSAQAVVRALWPASGTFARALLVGAVVAFDASLVEVVAVRAGMWRWAEPGHLDVPVIGILGWGYFAAGAEWALSLRTRWRRAALLIIGPAVAHALIFTTWWALFRWTLRGDLGVASTICVVAIGALLLLPVRAVRQAGRAIPMQVAAPRMIAASLFFALLLLTAPRDWRLWAHVAAVAVPWFAATALRPAHQ